MRHPKTCGHEDGVDVINHGDSAEVARSRHSISIARPTLPGTNQSRMEFVDSGRNPFLRSTKRAITGSIEHAEANTRHFALLFMEI